MRRAIACLAGMAFIGLGTFVEGAGVEADPNKEYLVTAKEGPWMIYVASYRGPEDHEDPALRPREMARRLVHELRSEYKLPAYMYNRTAERRREQAKALAEWHRKYGDAPARKIRIPDEWAVLVGNYKDMDDAAKALARLKKQPPPDSVPGQRALIGDIPGKPAPFTSFTGRSVNVKAKAVGETNPLAAGFACRNPLAPKPPAEEEKFDPFLTQLNAGEPYNLLKTRKPWTLMVKVYQGATVVVPEKKPSVFNSMRNARETEVERQFRLFNQGKGKDLETAGEMANNLAKVLRHKDLGYESYVLHTRTSSVVTVGSFSDPKDRELLRLQQELAGKKIGVVDLMAQPAIMKVPQP